MTTTTTRPCSVSLDDSALLEVFAESIAEVSRRKPERLTLDQPISELGLDSLAILEMIGLLEEAFSIEISEASFPSFHTLRNVADQIRLLRGATAQ